MKIFRFVGPLRLLVFAFLALVLSAPLMCAAGASSESNAAVTVTDNGRSWTLDNGIVKATDNKDSGSMTSLIDRGINIMRSGGGYWEQTPQDAPQLMNILTIDPATNGGARAAVTIKGVTDGTQMLTRGAPGGGTYYDMEIRCALG